MITVNKPSLVIIPTKTGITLQLIGARDNKFVREVIKYSNRCGYFVEIKESSTDLLPQRILIKFKSCNHKVANKFTSYFDLLLKVKNNYLHNLHLPMLTNFQIGRNL